MNKSQDQLVDKEQSLGELIELYEPAVWNYAFSLTRRQDLADDISQDVFVAAYRKLDSYRGESSIKTWLLAITRNVAANYQRQSFFRKVLLVDYITNTGAHPSAEAEAFENLHVQVIWNAILRLPVKLREVLVLHVQGLSHPEIAEVLQISESALKSRMHRARNKIATFLSEEGGSDAKLTV